MRYEDHDFTPLTDEEQAASEHDAELARKIRREVLRIRRGEADEEIRAEEEQLEAEAAEREEAAAREHRRRSSTLWGVLSGSILIRKGASEYYRYLICIAGFFFLSISVMFWSLRLDMRYTRLEREVQVLRERAVRLQEQRARHTTHSAVSEELRRRGIPLIDPESPAEHLEK